ncbi:class I SAM-dependent methyltransferase [Limnoraphis robusta Tam1]|uniref:Class I SAM-dependent methyltransferase n=1 Tax=Limnoraphis robusta CCNP1315 TaxID=3110306 RepID=A0ABU5TS52_9CYAN|nr:class I SAM-dependent methyltransferase [Limnoraphis robusta]MEA5517726.1 class I SAM-dependent methyltransferase [Limnoraphis robusta CCNP1315]MEA5540792.1 class I SAM-dependent methyltransferase [Limnoraphis robusta Tam1]MEA5546277.1 class I SAM-dependent methyltransferase [Limnoraphis robusta CCNP1324]
MISNDFNQLHPPLQAFIQDQALFPLEFNSLISEQDEMYLFALENHKIPEKARIRYYFNGRRIFDAVRQVVQWKFHSFNRLNSFLDFASGYGRFTRFLIQEIPPQNVWISDIYRDAVKFQQEQFGVNGIVSTASPAEYSVNQQFDCILACSFFSHLPEQTFTLWMQKLYHLISSEGILLFSVHDRDLLPPESKIKSDEILFIPQSESHSLDVKEYGTSYVGEEFVRQTVQNMSEGKAICERIPQGICRYQDLYIVAKSPLPDFNQLNFSHHPFGRLEQIHLTTEGELHIRGWVSEINPNSQIEAILISINGEFIKQVKPEQNSSADQTFSWSTQINLPSLSPEDIILIKAINTRNLEWVFEAATLEVLQAASNEIR